MSHNITHDVDHYEIGRGFDEDDPSTWDEGVEEDGVNRYEISGDDDDVGAGERMEIGEDGFPPGIDAESGYPPGIDAESAYPGGVSLGSHEPGHEGALDDEADLDEVGEAVKKVVEVARDNRQPPPVMRAVEVDAPEWDDSIAAWFADVATDACVAIGAADPFPLTTKLMTRFGAGQEKPRYVRVDTEETYPAFVADQSPEMAAMREAVAELTARFDAHVRDHAAQGALAEAVEEAEALGAEVAEVEQAKEIDLWLPERLEQERRKGNIRVWREGDCVCATICFNGPDARRRYVTAVTPAASGVEEMERHASEADVSAAAIVGVLPAMGCVLGAGTLLKEMSAAAPAIAARPEIRGDEPFVVRIEPAANPALCALFALATECSRRNTQACAEWDALASAAERGGAGPVVQAMREIKAIFAREAAGASRVARYEIGSHGDYADGYRDARAGLPRNYPWIFGRGDYERGYQDGQFQREQDQRAKTYIPESYMGTGTWRRAVGRVASAKSDELKNPFPKEGKGGKPSDELKNPWGK